MKACRDARDTLRVSWQEGKGPVIGGWRRVNTRITFNVPEERAYDKGAYDLETLALYVQHVAGSNVYTGLHGNWSDARIPRAGATHDRVLFINVRVPDWDIADSDNSIG